jgi:hypothetical protein
MFSSGRISYDISVRLLARERPLEVLADRAQRAFGGRDDEPCAWG